MRKLLLPLIVLALVGCRSDDDEPEKKCDCYERMYSRSAKYNPNLTPTHFDITAWVPNPPGEIDKNLTCEMKGTEKPIKTYFHHMYPDGSIGITETKVVIECN